MFSPDVGNKIREGYVHPSFLFDILWKVLNSMRQIKEKKKA